MRQDRDLAAGLASPEIAWQLRALYAFFAEISKSVAASANPMIGLIRLQHHRDRFAAFLTKGTHASDPAFVTLARVWPDDPAQRAAWAAEIQALMDALAREAEAEPFADLDALWAYLDASTGMLMRLAYEIAMRNSDRAPVAGEPGAHHILQPLWRAWGLWGLIGSLDFWARLGRNMVPQSLRQSEGRASLSPDEIEAGLIGFCKAQYAGFAPFARTLPADALPSYAYVSLLPLYWRDWEQDGPGVGNGRQPLQPWRKTWRLFWLATTRRWPSARL